MSEQAPKRRWFRFGLRTMFVVVTVFGCWLGYEFNRTRAQRSAVEQLRGMGDHVWYDYEIHFDFGTFRHTPISNASPSEPEWATRLFGVDFFHSPVALSFNTKGDKELACVRALPTLEAIWFGESNVTCTGIQHLKELTQLQELGFWQCRMIDDRALREIANLSNLRILNLTSTSVTDAGILYLDRLPKLRRLDVGNTQVTPDGLAQLKTIQNLDVAR